MQGVHQDRMGSGVYVAKLMDEAAPDGAVREQAGMPRGAARGLEGFVRHPVRWTKTYLDTCSIRAGFACYAMAATIAAVGLSLAAASALGMAAEFVHTGGERSVSGLYIYDEDRGAFVRAEDLSWYSAPRSFENRAGDDGLSDSERGASLYVESRSSRGDDAGIAVGTQAADMSGVVVEDIDARYVPEEDGSQVALADIPAYDAAERTRRAGVAQAEIELPADASGARPATSTVGYFVHDTPSLLYQAINASVFAVVPMTCAVCFAFAARGFYRRKLQAPIEAMIAAGDLAFSVPCAHDGSRSELDRLCASFETMRAQLACNNKAMWRTAENRRKANAAFAHDLRTPLTVLRGRAEMLSSCAAAGAVDVAALDEAARAMGRQAERLQRYVESMADLTEADECVVELREGDIGAWFVRAAAEGSDLARSAGVMLEASAGGLPRRAFFDDVALSRIVENALSNALRYADAVVRLTCSWDDGMLTLRVDDDGPGFAEAALAHACEPFWRDADEKRRADSAHFGLGLNICATLCERHGGCVRLENAAAGGASVVARVRVQAA